MHRYITVLTILTIILQSCKKEDTTKDSSVYTVESISNTIKLEDLKVPLYEENTTKLEDFLNFLPPPVDYPSEEMLRSEEVYNIEVPNKQTNHWTKEDLHKLVSNKDTIRNIFFLTSTLTHNISKTSLRDLYPFNKTRVLSNQGDKKTLFITNSLTKKYSEQLTNTQANNYSSVMNLVKYWSKYRANTDWYQLFNSNKPLFYTFFDQKTYINYEVDIESLLFAYEDLINNPTAVSKLKYALLKAERIDLFTKPYQDYYYKVEIDTTKYKIGDINLQNYMYVDTPLETINKNTNLAKFIITRYNNKSKILWYYSFWIRRAIEGNSSQYHKILVDLRNHYNSID
jgi:hypothetical protein